MAKSKKAIKTTPSPAKPPKEHKETSSAEPFTDVHERCAFLDGLKKIVDVAGAIIEDIPQAWRHGKSVTTETAE